MKNKRLEKANKELTMFDHFMMAKVMDDNVKMADLMVSIYLPDNDLRIVSVKCEVPLFSDDINGKDARADILAIDENRRSHRYRDPE